MFGLVILEAFAQRTPAIVHDLGALPGSGRGGSRRARLPHAEAELLGAIERLRSATRVRDELGAQGHDAWQRLWSEERHLTGTSTRSRKPGRSPRRDLLLVARWSIGLSIDHLEPASNLRALDPSEVPRGVVASDNADLRTRASRALFGHSFLSGVLRSFLTLAAGEWVARGIGVAIQIYLARQLTPGPYGVITFGIALSAGSGSSSTPEPSS